MSDEAKDTAPVEVTETAPVETAPVEVAPIEAKVEAKEEIKPSLLAALKGMVPAEKAKWLEKYKDDQSALNGIMSAQEMLGKKGDIPKEDASPEAIKEFWGKLGADSIEIKGIELGEDFGGMKTGLEEYYKGVGGKLNEIAKQEISKAKNIPDMLNRIFSRFANEDAQGQLQASKEQAELDDKLIGKLAGKTGLSRDQIGKTYQETMQRYGWGDETTKYEVMLELAKNTTNSKVMQDSYLHNTSEGVQQQIDAIAISKEYLHEDGPAHTKAVQQMRELHGKMEEIQKKKLT